MKRFTALLLVLLMTACSSAAPAPGPSARPPNIVFILVDDLDWDSLSYLPETETLIAAQGAVFSRYFVSLALCCPSRACILQGQYPHNTHILGNTLPGGGFEKFHSLGNEDSTVAVWLQAAGYRTALVGKYLNGYPETVGRRYIPPGWTEWYSPVQGDPYNQYNYILNQNGDLVAYGWNPGDYGTDVYAQFALDFMQRSLDAGQPFFVYIAPYAPHGPATPAPRHAGSFAGVKLPRTASFDEQDVGDKPQAIRSLPNLDRTQLDFMSWLYRQRLQSLQSVDEMVAALVEKLDANGHLENTYIFFMSDNGFHMGQHRLDAGKGTAYEEDIRVPLLVRGPGIPAGKVIPELAGSLDLAPTWAAIAGVAAPEFVDGRSLLPLLNASDPGAAPAWRQAFLLEKGIWQDAETSAAREAQPALTFFSHESFGLPLKAPRQAGRSAPLREFFLYNAPGLRELPDSGQAGALEASLGGGSLLGLRTTGYTYVEYGNGELELYDLRLDPHQMDNLAASADPALLAHLHAWLESLKDCTGASCREAENTSP